MSATNFTPIQLYRTTTASAAPSAGNLAAGELAINLTDEKLFFKNAGGTVKVLASSGTSSIGGSNTQVQYNNNGVLGGSSNFVFDGTNVGVGTTSLLGKFTVAGGYSFVTDDGTRRLVMGPDGTGVLLGTSTNHYLRFITNDTERMRILAGGSVGIGTTTPAYLLDVAGTVNTSQAVRFGASYFEGASAYAISRYLTNMTFNVPTGSGFAWAINGGDTMLINSSGNVGIGTSSPSERLHVVAASNYPGYFRSSTATAGVLLGGVSSAGTVTSDSSGTPLTFGIGGTEAVRITTAGNVGIGTSSPGARIAVAAANTAVASRGTAYLYSTNSMAANLGGQLSLGGSFTGTTETVFGSIAGRKENGTDNDIGGYLQFSTTNVALGNVERMRIDSSGNVGIGTTSTLCRLDVREANRADSTNIANVGIYTTSAQSTGVGGTLALGGLFNGADTAPFGSIRGGKQNSTSGNYDGYLAFQTIANGGVLTENMRITAAGNVNISNGNLVIGTALKGIDFSANTHAAGMTSELLNDYEEGTFTPTLSSDGTPPTVSGYANRYGSYTKIGNRVFISVNIRATITNAGTGTPQITGLPYASNNNALNGVSLGITDLMTVPFNANYINGSTLILGLGTYNVVTSAYITFSAMYEI